ncbi:MAG: hypothetical protein KDA99_17790, partial [Planctomycetales bacterium]|nr:hypothetical protein [Planctomycetales bacterium]
MCDTSAGNRLCLRRVFDIQLVLSVVLLLSNAVLGARYEFKKIATHDMGFPIIKQQSPTISDDGHVLFLAEYDGGEAGVISNGEELNVVTWYPDTGGSNNYIWGHFLGHQQANGAGEVVFLGGPTRQFQNLFLWTKGNAPKVLYSSLGGEETFLFYEPPAINDHGDIVFIGNGLGLPEAVFVGSREGAYPPTVLASTGGPLYEGFSDFFESRITEDGTVYVLAEKDGLRGIYELPESGVSRTIASSGDEFGLIESFDINNSHQITFGAIRPDGLRSVYKADASGTSLVVAENSRVRMPHFPAIDDNGEVIYRATISSTLDAILTGTGTVPDNLIVNENGLL